MIIRTDEVSGFIRTLSFPCSGKAAEEQAEALFQHFRDSHVIEGDFYGDAWILSNELHRTRMDFSLSEEAFEKGAGTWCGCSREEFLLAVRTGLAMNLGVFCLDTLSEIHRDVMKAGAASRSGITELSLSQQAVTLLCFLPGATHERDALLEDAGERRLWAARGTSAKRILADLQTFLDFEDRVRRFYHSATETEKIRWFPVFLWVNLSFCLPLRPTEFTLLPRDCIQGSPGDRTITVRRTRLKKQRGSVTYRIDGDYVKDTYPITDDLAGEILWYRDHAFSGKEPDGKTDQLFGADGPFTYAIFRQMLSTFVTHVIGFGEAKDLILPGCARHLAMIGLIMAGGSPEVCRVLAGHETIDQASWYYSNITSILEGAVLRLGSRTRLFEPEQHRFRLLPEGMPFHPVEGGRCNAMEVAAGDVSPCLNFYAPGRRTDSCRGCSHFYPYKEKQFHLGTDRDDTVGPEIGLLFDLIEQLRSCSGAKEPLRDMMARLKSESARILERLRRESDAETQKV